MSNQRLPGTEEDLLIRSLTSSFYTLSLEGVSIQQMIEQRKRRKLVELRLERAVCKQSTTICRDCGQRGHASRRSRECPQRTQSKAQAVRHFLEPWHNSHRPLQFQRPPSIQMLIQLKMLHCHREIAISIFALAVRNQLHENFLSIKRKLNWNIQ